MTPTPGALPPDLEALRARFADWRSTRTSTERIPETLWKDAVACAGQFGPYDTARALRLDYNALRRRMDAKAPGAKPRKQTFIEILPPGGIPAAECVLEVENRSGGKLRIHLRGGAVPDIARLARSFAGEKR